MKSKILITLALLLIILAACRKEELLLEDNDLNARLEEIRSMLTPKEINFFDYGFAARNNPHIIPGELIQFRDGVDEAFINSVIEKVLLDNAEHHFAGPVTEQIGYPAWNRSMILLEETEGYRVALIPFARLDDNSTRAYLVAFRPGDEWKFILVNREYFKQILQTENPADHTQDKTFYAIAFLWLDEMLFGNTDTDIEEWLLDNGSRAPELTSSQNQIETRCIVNHVVIWRCYRIIRAIRHPENPIDFRSPCTDGEILQGFIATFVNCGGSSGGGSSGSLFNPSSNWFGGGEGTGMGSGTFGGFGAGPSVFNHPYLAPIFSHCSLVEQAANGENAANITFTQEELEGCQQLTTIASQLFITPDNLAWLHYNNPSALQAIAAYLNSSNVSALERQALDAWAALLAAGKTNLLLRQFMPLYLLVYGEIVPALGLNANEAEFLLLSGNGALANEIWQLLQEDQATQDAQEIQAGLIAANILIDLHMADRENGPIDQTYANVLAPYTQYFSEEVLEECCTGSPVNDAIRAAMVATEEAIFLRMAHPEWSDNKIRWKAFKAAISGSVHTALDILGLVPGLGEPADLINGVLYLVEGEGASAALSFGAALPVVGWVSTGAKYATILYQVGNKTYRMRNYVDAAGQITFSHNGKLRAILGMGNAATDLRQAHHIIPQEFANHPIIQRAASSRDGSKVFHMNAHHNGVPVPNTRHNGSHPAYSARIQTEMNRWLGDYPNATPDQAAQSLRTWQMDLKNLIETSNQHINDIVPPSIPPPF